ncbi:uncharacterized protein LOC124817283 [Hydra vulgaris]|uniref:uncharacterized protein LOC124817283 n=1 Tax=Hydra vulgaris TaxID=6087 RepID=UPI001F5FCD05|nr:uncharacterized protein LOC124817283 [Hydra vulgaris]
MGIEVAKELNILKIAESVNEGSQEWISNFVIVLKANKTVRLCLDARTINKAIKQERYPIPTLDSVIDEMYGSKIFAKLDMKEVYTQLVEMDVESRKIINFQIDERDYRHKRLVYLCVDIMKITTTSSIISKLERLFAIFGYPNKIRSDNGPPFQSKELKLYFEKG